MLITSENMPTSEDVRGHATAPFYATGGTAKRVRELGGEGLGGSLKRVCELGASVFPFPFLIVYFSLYIIHVLEYGLESFDGPDPR